MLSATRPILLLRELNSAHPGDPTKMPEGVTPWSDAGSFVLHCSIPASGVALIGTMITDINAIDSIFD